MKIPMDLLKTFVVFAESKNVFEAAEKLNISQPAISVHLKTLESILGKDLFAMKGKKKVLNPFGQALFSSIAPKIQDLEFTADQILNQFKDLSQVTLRIAGRREMLTNLSKNLVFPGKTYFYSMGKDEAIQKLMDHKVDFAISQELPNLPNIVSKKIFSNSMRVLVHEDFVKNEKDIYEEDFYKNTPFIGYKEPMPYIYEWLDHINVPRNLLALKTMIDDWDAVVEMIERKKGFSLVPTLFDSENKKVLKIPISEKIIPPIHFYALYSSETKSLFPLDKVFKF